MFNKSLSFFATIAGVAGMLGLAAISTPAANAGTASANIGSSSNVIANCTIGTSNVAFGAYDAIVANASSPLTNTGSVTVTCTNGSPATITMDQGANPAAGSNSAAPQRRLADGSGNSLSYNLYSDSARTTVWDGTTGVGVTGSGVAQTLTVYGSVAPGQNLAPVGTYNDTVAATVSF